MKSRATKSVSGRSPSRPKDFFERILIAGAGGQGIIVLGKLIAVSALKTVPHITCFPNYGAEVRGGASNSQVILSSREIGAPIADRFESLILMDQESADNYLGSLAAGGLALVNKSRCRVKSSDSILALDASAEAEKMGDARVANLIMLGAWIARKPVLEVEQVEDGIRRMFGGKALTLVELNLRALRRGLELGEC
jgi:2-oxoglutarate ferredoxin oxidoreductase subunit gamma